MVTGGNRNPLITTPYHPYYQVVRLCVVIVVIKKEEIIYSSYHATRLWRLLSYDQSHRISVMLCRLIYAACRLTAL